MMLPCLCSSFFILTIAVKDKTTVTSMESDKKKGETKRETIISHGFYEVLDYIWELPNSSEKCSADELIILGNTYHISNNETVDYENIDPSNEINVAQLSDDKLLENSLDNEQPVIVSDVTNPEPDSPLNNIKAFFNKLNPNVTSTQMNNPNYLPNSPSNSLTLPNESLDDLYTRLWFTYRYGFPIIQRDKNGPSPLSIGSILRGSLDIQNMGKGFTTDSGWGCMIRTSQSLLANTLISLRLGRDWRLTKSSIEDLMIHWEIVEQFADVPEASFSIQNYVLYAAKYCGKKPGEWFGPSNASKSIQKLCEEKQTNEKFKLKVYISTDSGDVFDDEIMKLSKEDNNESSKTFNPILLLCGVRLGVKNVNPIYWEFLKYLLKLPYNVGISGGRPSSSHYFFGYQGDDLFYLDPHFPQHAILLNKEGHINEIDKLSLMNTIHSRKLRRLNISKIDPSMLIGFLIKSNDEYNDFKDKIKSFDNNKKFLNIYDSRPSHITSLSSDCSELDGFIDIGISSIHETYDCCNDGNEVDNRMLTILDDKPETNNNQLGINQFNNGIENESNLGVDAFDLNCDPSEIRKKSVKINTKDNDSIRTKDESLVIVTNDAAADPPVVVVLDRADVEEH